jgi:CRP-like cAMP-binding protein/SAM-dependent methyltransferase
MIHLFQLLSDSSVDWIVHNSTEARVDAGEVLIREGTRISSMYIVTEGLLGVYTGSAGNKKISHVGPGAVVGEMSFVEDSATAASIIAIEQTHLLELSRDKLSEQTTADPIFAADFYRAIAVTLSQRLRTAQASARADAGPAYDDPHWRAAVDLIADFKRMLLEADQESIKNDVVSEETYQRLDEKLRELQLVSKQMLIDESPLSPYMREQLGALLQTELLPFVLMTSTAERFYSKPRGYAGDYFTIERIYQNQPSGAGRLGAVFDRLFLEAPASVAVRNRRPLIVEEIKKTLAQKRTGPARVLSLACGPAREITDVYASLTEKTKLVATLLDIDLQALAFVADWRDKAGLKTKIQLLNANLIQLALGRASLDIPPQDLVYSIGLIDYFDERLVIKMLDFIYKVLAPGGRVILGNFHIRNPSRAIMDFLLEWHLVHRTEEDMDRLFEKSAFRRKSTNIRFEPQGVNMFAECIKEIAPEAGKEPSRDASPGREALKDLAPELQKGPSKASIPT